MASSPSRSAAVALVTETDCYVQPQNASLELAITTLTAIDLSRPDMTPGSRCFVGGTEAMYMSSASVYLATTRHAYSVAADAAIRYAPQVTTDIHKFAVSPSAIHCRGSGEVAGHLGWGANT